KDGDKIGKWMVGLAAPERAEELREIGRRSWDALGGYIRGTAINGVVNGTVLGMKLVVLGVPLAVPLAFLTFVGAFIPLVGAIVTVPTQSILLAIIGYYRSEDSEVVEATAEGAEKPEPLRTAAG